MAVTLNVLSEFDGKGVQKAIKEFKSLEGSAAKTGFVIKKAAVPAAAAVAGLAAGLGAATMAAIEDAKAQAQLALDLHNVAGASKSSIASAENWIATQALATGITDDQLRPALAALVRGTKDVAMAQNALSLAMDISTATGMDLTSVSDALAKAYQGNFKALRSLSPEMASMIKEGATLEEVMNVLGGTFGGSTAVAAETVAGKMQRMKVAFDETVESIGAMLIPVLEQVLPYLQKAAEWANKNPEAFLKVAAAVGAIAGAILALNVAMKIWTATQVAVNVVVGIFNALMAMNPVVLVVAGIVALIAVLVLAYNKFDWFRNFVNAVFNGIKNAVMTSLDVIKGVFTGYMNFYKAIFNGIAKLWNSTIGKIEFTIPSWVPIIGGKEFKVPNIPMLAEGGVVNKPTLAMIGERGPEAVVPLNRYRGGSGGIIVNINSTVADASLPDKIVQALRDYNRTTGPIRVQVA
jgi:hypothetical protein